MRVLPASLVAMVLSVAGPAQASGHGKGQSPERKSWWQRINLALEEAAAPYKIVPPTPVSVRWNATKIWAGELPGELVDMVGVDLSADGKSELVALTNREVVVFSQKRGLFDIRTQVALPDKPARTRSRDPIGSLSTVVSADAPVLLRARSSDQTVGASYQLVDNALVAVAEFPGYPLCGQAGILGARGRNYFLGRRATWPKTGSDGSWAEATAARKLAENLYSLQCTGPLPDPRGKAARYLSAVSTSGELSLYCDGEEAHCQAMASGTEEVGDTHLLADVDNDGYPEVFLSARSAPGGADRLLVIGHAMQPDALIFHKDFSGGIVGMAAGDFAGDGALEVVVAVRKFTTGRVTLWLLN